MRICTECVLPASFPGISFDHEGVCSYCANQLPKEKHRALVERCRHEFETIAQAARDTQGLQCLVAYSGGKDSTYTMMILRQRYGLRLLALTFDNGFLSPHALTNAERVTCSLDVDHVIVRPRGQVLRQLFARVAECSPFPAKALERASSVCNACMGLAKNILLKTAIEKSIPLIAYGWSPGQIPVRASVSRLSADMVMRMQESRMAPIIKMTGDALSPYLLDPKDLERGRVLPLSVSPLAFLDYDEETMIARLRELGWYQPDDTDGNSTNCLLNLYANRLHLRKHRFHPYAFEVAGLVRGGHLSREAGLARLGQLGSIRTAEEVANRLGVSPEV